MKDLSPREFLQAVPFDQQAIIARFPNARRHMEGGLFISHSGIDTERIHRVITPVTFPRFAPDGAFLHSRLSGGSEGYRQLVQAALHWSASFLLVLSRASLANEWVHAEAEWALENSRPLLVARFDETDWATMCERLQLSRVPAIDRPSWFVDFRHDERRAAAKLAAALDALPMKYRPSEGA